MLVSIKKISGLSALHSPASKDRHLTMMGRWKINVYRVVLLGETHKHTRHKTPFCPMDKLTQTKVKLMCHSVNIWDLSLQIRYGMINAANRLWWLWFLPDKSHVSPCEGSVKINTPLINVWSFYSSSLTAAESHNSDFSSITAYDNKSSKHIERVSNTYL